MNKSKEKGASGGNKKMSIYKTIMEKNWSGSHINKSTFGPSGVPLRNAF